jgi:aminopeptidase N
MALAPYDASAGGPSSAAILDQTMASDNAQSIFDTKQMNIKLGQQNTEQDTFARPQLESSLGATGQFNSGAARLAEAHQAIGFDSARNDITSAFARTQMDMKRQEVFAGLGLVLG